MVPLSWEPTLDSLTVRDERLRRTWEGIAPGSDPARTAFVMTSVSLPNALERPEVRALLQGLGPGVSIDEAAEQCGFTRAEAVHLLGVITAAGSARRDPEPVGAPPSGCLRTPEEFGGRSVDAADLLT